MKRNKPTVGVPEERQPSSRLVSVLMVQSLIIGTYLTRPVLARPNSDAPGMGSKKISEASGMNKNKSSPVQRSVQTASGRISYTGQTKVPVQLFLHGGFLKRHI